MSAGDGAGDDPGAGGVLGNLPRSRPGHRSDKRREPASRPSGSQSMRPGEPAAKGGGSAAPERGRASARPVVPAPSGSAERGPLGGAARVAGRAARAGLGVAGGVLKRLPRP